MSTDVYQTPKADLSMGTEALDKPIWNPDAAGAWSLLLSPLFGSILVYKNWKVLGEDSLASKSIKWIVISIFVLILSIIIPYLGLAYIITWYLLSQKKQTQYLKSKYNGNYPKKGWIKPLLIAVASFVSFVVVLSLITMLVSQAF